MEEKNEEMEKKCEILPDKPWYMLFVSADSDPGRKYVSTAFWRNGERKTDRKSVG